MDGEPRELFTVPEVAKELKKPQITLYRWIKADKMVAVKLGGILFVPLSEVRRFKRKLSPGDNSTTNNPPEGGKASAGG